MNYTQKIFAFSLFFSVIIIMTSNNWFIVWFGLELNMMSFIPLIIKNNKMSSESSMKYFFVQSVASLLILLTCISSSFFIHDLMLNNLSTQISYSLIALALYTKMGASPFHFWFPSIMEGLNWSSALLLMTWQKLAPLVLSLSYVSSKIIFIVIILSTFIGTLGGFNQLLLRKMMAYSSINHISWMLFSTLLSEDLMFLYFALYSLMLISFVLFLLNKNSIHISQLLYWKSSKKIKSSLLFLMLLSLGGLPPFVGFFPKWVVLSSSLSSPLILISLTLILTSMITLYFYLRLTLSSFMLDKTNNMHMKKELKNIRLPLFLMTNLFTLPVILFLY